MSLTLGLALFFIIWWTALFAVLPFGVHTQAEAGEVLKGTPESAPNAHMMATVVRRTTILAVIIFGLVWLALRYRLIPLEITQ